MTARKKATVAGVRRVVAQIDATANVIQHHFESLGLSEKVARDFAYRSDLITDHMEKTFGIKNAGYYNPAEIGEEEPGPLIMDSNNPFMNGHFTQEKFVELAEKQMSGELAANAASHTADPNRTAKLIATQAAKLAFTQLADWVKKEASKKAKKGDDEPAEEEKKEAKKSEEEEQKEAAKSASDFGLFTEK